ncbi:MAG TPA: DUF1289 domain-containing protein [Moraxellaceae bacterium]|nr:DUF1289 domain-containing protein [Moraxellaceae bacterium]
MSPFDLSPCIGWCRLDDDNMCLGCFRIIDEIRGWGLMTREEQRRILESVAERRQRLSFSAPESSACRLP